MKFTVGDTVTNIFPQGFQSALLIRNDGPGTVFLDSVSSVNPLNSYPLPPRSSIVWKAGTALFAISETGSTIRAVINDSLTDQAGYEYAFLADVTNTFKSGATSEFIEVGGFNSIRVHFQTGSNDGHPRLFSVQWCDDPSGFRETVPGRLFATGINEDVFSFVPRTLFSTIDIPVRARYCRFAVPASAPPGHSIFWTVQNYARSALLFGSSQSVRSITYTRCGDALDAIDWGFLREGDVLTASTAKASNWGVLPLTIGAGLLDGVLAPGRYAISVRCNAVTTAGNLVFRAGWDMFSTIAQLSIPAVTGYTTYVGGFVMPGGVSPVVIDWAPPPVTTGTVTISIYPYN